MKQDLGRYLGRPGRSLTRRLIWLASAWILVALLATGAVLTSQFQESGLRRLGGVLNNTIDELVRVATVRDDRVVVPQIQDARTLDILSGKYWAVAQRDGEGRLMVVARSTSLWDADMPIPASLPDRVAAAAGATVSYNAHGPNNAEPLRVAASQKLLPGRAEPVVFIAAINRSDIDSDTRQFAALTWIALGLLGAGLMAAVFFQVRIGLRPLYELGQEIGDVRKGRATRISRDYPV
ncbi:MAG: sensor histidine kinase, partial [Brevundimonas sp.]